PIGRPFTGAPNFTRRPSAMEQSSAMAGSANPSSPTRKFRTSLEKVFKRGLSFESSRRSNSMRAGVSVDEVLTSGKIPDEEQGLPTASTTATFPEVLPSPQDFRS